MRFNCRAFFWAGAWLALGVLVIPMLRSKDRGEGASLQIPALSTFKDDVIGFSVKRPAGWRLRYTTGVIAVLKNDQASEGVLIYPVRPKAGFTLQDFLTGYLNILKASSTSTSRIEFAGLSADRCYGRHPSIRFGDCGRSGPGLYPDGYLGPGAGVCREAGRIAHGCRQLPARPRDRPRQAERDLFRDNGPERMADHGGILERRQFRECRGRRRSDVVVY